jgi:hypothetical protein
VCWRSSVSAPGRTGRFRCGVTAVSHTASEHRAEENAEYPCHAHANRPRRLVLHRNLRGSGPTSGSHGAHRVPTSSEVAPPRTARFCTTFLRENVFEGCLQKEATGRRRTRWFTVSPRRAPPRRGPRLAWRALRVRERTLERRERWCSPLGMRVVQRIRERHVVRQRGRWDERRRVRCGARGHEIFWRGEELERRGDARRRRVAEGRGMGDPPRGAIPTSSGVASGAPHPRPRLRPVSPSEGEQRPASSPRSDSIRSTTPPRRASNGRALALVL